MNSPGFRGVWAGILVSGAFGLAGACDGSSRDFGNPTGGSSGSGGDSASGSSSGGSPNSSGDGSGGEGAALTAGGSETMLGGAGGGPGGACTPGETQSCYESADGQAYQGKPADNQTTCRLGERLCNTDGTWDACMGAVGPEAADTCEPGNDADCSGTPNEGCTCTNGEKRTCTSDVGTCVGGEQACSGSAWGECAGCKLIDGQTCAAAVDCDSGTCTSFYLDADKDGYRANSTVVKFCGAAKTGYVAVASNKGDDCPGDADAALNPDAAEVCDGIDNNCDGKIDMAGNAALKLSGTSKSLLVGTLPAIAAAGSIYGIAYTADKTYLITLNQNNTIQLAKTAIDADYSYNTAIAWDGTSFGIFYKDPNSNYLQFRKATTAGAFSPASRVDVGQPTGGGSYVDYFAVRLPNNTWFLTGWSSFQGDWSWLFSVDDTYVPSAEISITAAGCFPNVAVSGNSVGLVWRIGNSQLNTTGTLELSLRDKTGMTETKHVQLRDTPAGARKPVIAARAGGGFGVMWNESSGVYFQEFSNTGASQCGPTYKAFTDFEPNQMVATKRGYLAVSGYNKVVKAQEVLSGCTYGTSFPNIGTSGTNDQHVHLAAGTNGFAVVWDDDTNVYARTFGPNLCD
jgi:Putative metal-binding motif